MCSITNHNLFFDLLEKTDYTQYLYKLVNNNNGIGQRLYVHYSILSSQQLIDAIKSSTLQMNKRKLRTVKKTELSQLTSDRMREDY